MHIRSLPSEPNVRIRSSASFGISHGLSTFTTNLPPLLYGLCAPLIISCCRYTLMCRNIKTLFNFDPPVTDGEIRAASLQFVRKITGFNKPSRAKEAAFYSAVDDVAMIATRLLDSLQSTAPPKNR